MSDEKAAWDTFRKKVPFIGDRLDRIENFVGAGFPDTNVCIGGTESWIEIKAPSEPKRSCTPLFGSNHKLSIDQRNWLLRQYRAGGNGYVYIETDNHRMLISGNRADIINSMSVHQLLAIAVWRAKRRLPRREDWNNLRQLLADGAYK